MLDQAAVASGKLNVCETQCRVDADLGPRLKISNTLPVDFCFREHLTCRPLLTGIVVRGLTRFKLTGLVSYDVGMRSHLAIGTREMQIAAPNIGSQAAGRSFKICGTVDVIFRS